jgi:comEA protein
MFNLTRQERLVIIFLALVILAGLGISYLLKTNSRFNYFYRCADIARQGAITAVNINTANEDELVQLPGVGRQTAADIVAYRRAHGDFKDKQELKNIKGIGEKKFLRMKDYLIIRAIPGM